MGICYDDNKKPDQSENNSTPISPPPPPPIPPIKNELEEYFHDLDNFMENMIIQDYLSKNKEESRDIIFNELKSFEKKDLSDYMRNKYKEYKTILDNGNLNLINIDDNLISNIINYENTEAIYQKKIINEIKCIKNDDKKYAIDHLTILLIGRKGVGKTTLIKYILKLDDNEEIKPENVSEYFISYRSKKVPHLQLIEFKGFGLDNNNDPENIGKKALECIRNKINSNNNKNYNDFIHCIWFCITGTRFEKPEFNLLKRLSEAYNDNIMPIIVVYTQLIDKKAADEMYKYIKKQDVKTSFVQVLAKDTKIMKSQKIKKAFGGDGLLNKTLLKCTQALKGDMINIMTKIFSDAIKTKLIDYNTEEIKNIGHNIINKFIKEYNYILSDEGFKNHIVLMFGNSLFPFYKNHTKGISNKSLNLLKKSFIINSINDFIKYYQPKVDELIKQIINEKAELFLDKQSSIEIEKYNMRLENKRNLNGFKNTTNIFLKRNYYYISQKYIIFHVIKKILWKYLDNYKEKLNHIIRAFLENDNDKNIKQHLDDCFLTKLEKFAKNKKIDISITHPLIDDSDHESSSAPPVLWNKEFDKGDIAQKSIELVDDFKCSETVFPKIQINNEKENWYPFKQNNWKYLDEKSKDSLNDFLQNNMIYQESYFNIEDNDIILKSLKEYEREDLVNFFELKKKEFIREKINNVYKNKYIYHDSTKISEITSSKKFKEILMNKITNKIDIINKEKDFCKIDYLSIIVIGKSGVGKSTLINGMLKEKLAKTGIGDKITIEDKSYKSKSIPFLRFFDTRGIELEKEYGPEKILQNTMNIIKNQNSNDKNYNDYIQCIWYCVRNEFEEKEIEILKTLKKNEKSLPFIIVFTYAINAEIVKKVSSFIKENFKDNEFLPVLAESIDSEQTSYGLDDLLNKTLKVCKKTIKGNIFKKIRELSFGTIEKYFKENNKNIKKNICNNIVNIFTSNYKEVLNDDNLLKFIYNLLESIFLEYINFDEQNKIKELTKQNRDLIKGITSIQDYITKYIEHYKNISKDVINPILDTYAIKYLEVQINKEKIQFSKCLNNKKKYNKNGFKEIINKFLNDNFYYISQKYLIYRIITDVCESILDTVENNINNIIKNYLNQNNPDILENIYYQKFEDLKEIINGYKNKDTIYNENDNENIQNIKSSYEQIENDKNSKNKDDAPPPF